LLLGVNNNQAHHEINMMMAVVLWLRVFNDKKSKMIITIITTRSRLQSWKDMLRVRKESSMVWFGVLLASSLFLCYLLPTPVAIGIFILLAFFIYISLVLRKLLAAQYKNVYNTSNSIIKYHCMLCGKYHNDKSCPVCGSKMKKASF
jgi:hypothetical protein